MGFSEQKFVLPLLMDFKTSYRRRTKYEEKADDKTILRIPNDNKLLVDNENISHSFIIHPSIGMN